MMTTLCNDHNVTWFRLCVIKEEPVTSTKESLAEVESIHSQAALPLMFAQGYVNTCTIFVCLKIVHFIRGNYFVNIYSMQRNHIFLRKSEYVKIKKTSCFFHLATKKDVSLPSWSGLV